jgi:AhpD family alkylhydroperoxidase
MTTRLLKTFLATVLALLGLSASAGADPAQLKATREDIQKTLGFVPIHFQKLPDALLTGAWEETKGLELNPNTALDGRTKELIGLAVSAQIPCRYCIVAHTEFAKLNGASEAELGEAVGMAAITRHWSTFLNGVQTDEAHFRADIAKIIANVKRAAASQQAAATVIDVVDGASALQDITATFGFVPDYLAKFPDAGRAGAWKQLRDLELNPSSALSGKHKELIGLAVSSQIPCRFCIVAHTEFARLNGASEAEIREAIGFASFTRSMSTLLNGVQVDEAQFRRDVERLVRNAKAAAKRQAVSQR